MKVLLIDVFCKQGSTGKIVYDLYTELRNRSDEAIVCYGRGRKIFEPNIYKISHDIEMMFHLLLARITGLNGFFSLLATIRTISIIKQFKPDVVHIHDPKTYYLNFGKLVKFLKRENISTIWTFHSEFLYTGKCGHAYDCLKWQKQCFRCPQLHEYPKSLFFDFTKFMHNHKKLMFSDFDNLVIVSPSHWLADRARASFLSNKKIVVINNGIDTENIFHPSKYDLLKEKHSISDKKVILSVAPNIYSDLKGGAEVLKIANSMDESDIVFILIGTQEESIQVNGNIIEIPKVTNQELLAQYYSLADIFLICSKVENFPTTCIEALCCGTPIVGYDVGGVSETAPSGLGFFSEYGDREKVIQNIRALLASDNNIKERCFEYGITHYSRKKMFDNYYSLYKEMTNS